MNCPESTVNVFNAQLLAAVTTFNDFYKESDEYAYLLFDELGMGMFSL